MLDPKRHHINRYTSLLIALCTTAGCAAPITQMRAVSAGDIKVEQVKQQTFTIETDWKSQQRLDGLALPILKAALPLCEGNVAVRTGATMSNVYAYNREWQEAARAAGLSDTVSIISIAKGSPAEKAGLRRGDKILDLAGTRLISGTSAMREVESRMTAHFAMLPSKKGAPVSNSGTIEFNETTLPLTIQRDQERLAFTVPMDTVCAYRAVAQKSGELNAFADGRNIYVTSTMMRFASDDSELEIVIAHEIAHNAMRHMDAKNRNAGIGALFGALLDVAAATQGVNTNGQYTSEMASAAAATFSQDFEREADYVGLYLLARTGRSIAGAPMFWRLMATESPGSIRFATSHPTTAERYLRLEQTINEIEEKRANGKPLLPELKKKR